jgi:hypothetical protein
MGSEETEHNKKKQTSQKDSNQTLGNLTSELETIRVSLRKGKTDTTTLKILFYTGLAVLLFGFIYTNQTLQRAQHRNLESHISLLQGQVNHTMLLLEKKLHKEILDLDTKLTGTSSTSFYDRIQNLNNALDQLEPQATSINILIERVKRTSSELSHLIEAENLEAEGLH